MNGRVYDYQLGRFLSVDPFIQFPLNSQSLNPYSYLGNNPLSGTDPTGYCEAATGTHITDCAQHQSDYSDGSTKNLGSVNLKNPGEVGDAIQTALSGQRANGVVSQGPAGASGRGSVDDRMAGRNSGNGTLTFDDAPDAHSPSLLSEDQLARTDRFDFSKLQVTDVKNSDPQGPPWLQSITGSISVGGSAANYASQNMNHDMNTSGLDPTGMIKWTLSIAVTATTGRGDLTVNWMGDADRRAITAQGGNVDNVDGHTKEPGSSSIVLNMTHIRAPIAGFSDADASRVVAHMETAPTHEFVTHTMGQVHTPNATGNITSYAEFRSITWDDFRLMRARLDQENSATPRN
jgi:hypothetical protein